MLKRPILICALGGWGDAGRSGSLALQHLVTAWNAKKFADVDADTMYDLSSARPWVQLDENGERRMTWPGTSFFARRDPNGEIDAILIQGTEPSFRWRAFCDEVVALARSHDARMLVTFGAFPAQVSHRDAVHVTGWAAPNNLNERLKSLDVAPVNYEGPTNLVTALGCAFAEAGIPVAALWCAVPAYLGATPNPKGALALVQLLNRALDLGLDLGDLRSASAAFERSVTRAIRRAKAKPSSAFEQILADGQATAADSADPSTEVSADSDAELPSADEVIRGAESFLREQRGD